MCLVRLIYLLLIVLTIVLGVTHKNVTTRKNAREENRYKFIVSIRINGSHRSTGSLITPKCVISYAEHLYDGEYLIPTEYISIKAGTQYLDANDAIVLKVTAIHILTIEGKNVLALTKLERAIDAPSVKTIDINKKQIKYNSVCIRVGWFYKNGAFVNSMEQASQALLKVEESVYTSMAKLQYIYLIGTPGTDPHGVLVCSRLLAGVGYTVISYTGAFYNLSFYASYICESCKFTLSTTTGSTVASTHPITAINNRTDLDSTETTTTTTTTSTTIRTTSRITSTTTDHPEIISPTSTEYFLQYEHGIADDVVWGSGPSIIKPEDYRDETRKNLRSSQIWFNLFLDVCCFVIVLLLFIFLISCCCCCGMGILRRISLSYQSATADDDY